MNVGLTGDLELILNHVASKFLLKDNPTESDLNDAKLELTAFGEKMKQNTNELFSIIKKIRNYMT